MKVRKVKYDPERESGYIDVPQHPRRTGSTTGSRTYWERRVKAKQAAVPKKIYLTPQQARLVKEHNRMLKLKTERLKMMHELKPGRATVRSV